MFKLEDVQEGDMLEYTGTDTCCWRNGTQYPVERGGDDEGNDLVFKPSCWDCNDDYSMVYALVDLDFVLVKRSGPW